MLHRPPTHSRRQQLDEARRESRRRRDRAYRRRRDAGIITVSVQLDGVALDWLIHARALDEHALELPDLCQIRQAVGEAVTALIKVSSRI
jgi:hypothetical protein